MLFSPVSFSGECLPSTCADMIHDLALLYAEFNVTYSRQTAKFFGDIFQSESCSIGEALHFFHFPLRTYFC